MSLFRPWVNSMPLTGFKPASGRNGVTLIEMTLDPLTIEAGEHRICGMQHLRAMPTPQRSMSISRTECASGSMLIKHPAFNEREGAKAISPPAPLARSATS